MKCEEGESEKEDWRKGADSVQRRRRSSNQQLHKYQGNPRQLEYVKINIIRLLKSLNDSQLQLLEAPH